MYCPDCQEEIIGITIDEITDCSDHLSHENLQEAYRWLKDEHKRLEERFSDLIKDTLIEKLLADLKEANMSRGKWASNWYSLYKKVGELESRCKYKEAHIEELELENKLLRDSEKRTIENLKEIMAIQNRINRLKEDSNV